MLQFVVIKQLKKIMYMVIYACVCVCLFQTRANNKTHPQHLWSNHYKPSNAIERRTKKCVVSLFMMKHTYVRHKHIFVDFYKWEDKWMIIFNTNMTKQIIKVSINDFFMCFSIINFYKKLIKFTKNLNIIT